MFRVLSIVALSVSLAACGGDVSFPPPPQREPIPHRINAVLQLAPDHNDLPWASIVEDVAPPAPDVDWRWTRAHPSFRFELMDYAGWQMTARITIVEKVLASAGPQHISAHVNDAVVGAATFPKAGNYDLTFRVPPEVLKADSPIRLRLDIDPCLLLDSTSEKGLPYCILLHSIGFVRDAL